jgi:hypothetical protein
MISKNSFLVNWISVTYHHLFFLLSSNCSYCYQFIDQANGVLAVTVHSCSKINASEGSLNPFIRFYLDKAQELEKTAICENTSAPNWNETKFLLLNNLDSILTMELRTTNNTKKAGKRLARANFNLKDIKNEKDLELDNLFVVYCFKQIQKLTCVLLGICLWSVTVNVLPT